MPTKGITIPRYQEIAIEIAERIVANRYKEGEKLSARSTLSSTFNVSPETVRRGINVLVDLEIMESKHGSGVYVASRQKAEAFLEQYKDVKSIQEIKQDIQKSVANQKAELDHFSDLINTLVSQTTRLRNENPFLPSEIQLTEQAMHLDQTISELNIWHETSATVIAIATEDRLLLSPGPYAKFSVHNTVYFIGDEQAQQRMQNFFYPKDEIN